jgi:hypothetical protein
MSLIGLTPAADAGNLLTLPNAQLMVKARVFRPASFPADMPCRPYELQELTIRDEYQRDGFYESETLRVADINCSDCRRFLIGFF